MNAQPFPTIVLASSSPRRRDLLAARGIPYRVVKPTDVDETPRPNESPPELVQRLAVAKAANVARHHPNEIVLGSDTIVAFANEPLGKPPDLDAAYAMLRRLSGRTHQVLTGVCLCRLEPARQEIWCAISEVTFKPLDETAIRAACQLTNPLDKAGAYAIQTQETVLVDRFTGLRSTIIGLPVEEVAERLPAF